MSKSQKLQPFTKSPKTCLMNMPRIYGEVCGFMRNLVPPMKQFYGAGVCSHTERLMTPNPRTALLATALKALQGGGCKEDVLRNLRGPRGNNY